MARHDYAIDVDGLTVRRGRRPVLSGLSCQVAAGSVTGLLGPSGSGKTTLLRAVVGVQIVAAGRVTVLGHPAGAPPLRRRIGYVTQSPSVYADLTVRENARYFAALAGAGPSAADRAVDEVGLSGAAGQLVGTLSGGQRNRASLACAFVGQPDLLVLDEPTVGLDPLLREELWAVIRRRAHAGTTVLVSSHVMDEATRCDRLLLLRDGALVGTDSRGATPDELLAHTGARTLDAAFLHLVRAQVAAGATTELPAGGHR